MVYHKCKSSYMVHTDNGVFDSDSWLSDKAEKVQTRVGVSERYIKTVQWVFDDQVVGHGRNHVYIYDPITGLLGHGADLSVKQAERNAFADLMVKQSHRLPASTVRP